MVGLSRPEWLWLNTKIVYPRTVTHPSTNRASHRVWQHHKHCHELLLLLLFIISIIISIIIPITLTQWFSTRGPCAVRPAELLKTFLLSSCSLVGSWLLRSFCCLIASALLNADYADSLYWQGWESSIVSKSLATVSLTVCYSQLWTYKRIKDEIGLPVNKVMGPPPLTKMYCNCFNTPPPAPPRRLNVSDSL